MKNSPKITVVIPSYKITQVQLKTLYESLLQQHLKQFEVVIVDDCSPSARYDSLKDPRFRIIQTHCNSGPATARNLGAQSAESDFLFFTDSDCALAPETLQSAVTVLHKEHISVGNTITTAETSFGRIVGYLGFPGGGLLGFPNVWKVDAYGYTISFSSCNVAITKQAFETIGKFDTSFPVAGGEDTVFAKNALKNNYAIKYTPEQIVFHEERKSWSEFRRWQITRGRGNFHIKKKLGKVGSFFRLRLWSFSNSLKAAGLRYGLQVFLLILASAYFQARGYSIEKKRFSGK